MSRADSRVRDTSRRNFYSVAASIFLKKKHESIRNISYSNLSYFFSLGISLIDSWIVMKTDKRAFILRYKSPNMQTMDDKAELVQKLLSWLFGEIQQEREWFNTPDSNLVEIQDNFPTYFLINFRIKASLVL